MVLFCKSISFARCVFAHKKFIAEEYFILFRYIDNVVALSSL